MKRPPQPQASESRPRIDPDDASSSIDAVRHQLATALAEADGARKRLRGALSQRSRELLQTRAELRALTEAFPDLLVRLDADGTILDCRAGEATGPYHLMTSAVGQRLDDLPERSIVASLEG